MAVAMNAWRGLAEMPVHRAWPETWAGGSASTRRAVGRARETFRQFTAGLGRVRIRCLLFGHDDSVAREPNRLLLRCGECGRRTRGWAIATSVPRPAARLAGRNAPREIHGRSRRSPSTLRILR